MKNQFLKIILFMIATMGLSGCWWDSPEPLTIEIGGYWQWVETRHTDGRLLESSNPNNARFIAVEGMPVNSGYLEAMRFYLNGNVVDSLFVLSTDNYRSAKTDKKNDQVFAHYVDGAGEPAVVHFKFFFQKKKRSSTRMEINIQKNTSMYEASADTVKMVYTRLDNWAL